MKRRISSVSTDIAKAIILVMSGLYCGWIVAIAFEKHGFPPVGFFVLGAVFAMFLRIAFLSRTVHMDDEFLYVTNYRRATPIPRSQIASVTETRKGRSHWITIEFASATPFGQSIIFTPTMDDWDKPHPIVAELSSHLPKPPA